MVYERKQFVIRLIELFGGPKLNPEQVYVVENPRGGNQIATENGRIIAFIVTKKYLLGPEAKLVAIVAHELSNEENQDDLTMLDLVEIFLVRLWKQIGLAVPQADGKMSARSKIGTFLTVCTRTIFEGPFMGYKRILRRKLAADKQAIILMRKHLFPLYGYLDFLNEASERSQEFQFPRRLWHQWIVKQRIFAVMAHLKTL